MGEVWEALTGASPSASTVSRVFHTLEDEYRAWKSRPLCERYEYLFADGTYFTVIYEDEGCKMPILVGIGIKPDGEREVLGFGVGDRENQQAWEEVLEDLKRRGVREVGLLITDGHQAPRVGAFAPDFELVDVHTNQPLKLSSLRGKPVFMNFWGTWCPPCRAEMPEMQKLHNKYRDQVQIVGVTMGPRDNPANVKEFVDAAKYDWTFIHDPDYNVATTYQVQAISSSYFIDKEGVIRAIQIGAMGIGQMEAYLQQVR